MTDDLKRKLLAANIIAVSSVHFESYSDLETAHQEVQKSIQRLASAIRKEGTNTEAWALSQARKSFSNLNEMMNRYAESNKAVEDCIDPKNR